jgi:hypothetical protein
MGARLTINPHFSVEMFQPSAGKQRHAADSPHRAAFI